MTDDAFDFVNANSEVVDNSISGNEPSPQAKKPAVRPAPASLPAPGQVLASSPVKAVVVSASARRSGSVVDGLTARLSSGGLPPDVQVIVDVCVRAGLDESDPNWVWLLPLLLRQVTAAALRLEFQALSASFNLPGREEKSSKKNEMDVTESLETLLSDVSALRSEVQKFPRRLGESLKPALMEAVADAVETSPGRVKVEVDESKLTAAARDAFMNLYVLIAVLGGAVSTLVAFIVGSKFG